MKKFELATWNTFSVTRYAGLASKSKIRKMPIGNVAIEGLQVTARRFLKISLGYRFYDFVEFFKTWR